MTSPLCRVSFCRSRMGDGSVASRGILRGSMEITTARHTRLLLSVRGYMPGCKHGFDGIARLINDHNCATLDGVSLLIPSDTPLLALK